MSKCTNMFFELVDSARQSTDKTSAFSVKAVVGYNKFSASDKKKIKTEMRTREKAYKQNKATDYKRTLLRFMRECGIPRDCAEECKAVD